MPTTRTAAAAPSRRGFAPRALAWPVAAVLSVGVAACGDDGDEVEAAVDPAAVEAGDLADLGANGMLGLEVTAVGNITEMVANNAFRMDKDGLDPATDLEEGEALEGEPDTYEDLQYYYDVDSLTAGDEELGYGTDQEEVLVLVPGGDLDLRADDPVRVVGTIRALDAEAIEEVYEVEIDADVYAPYRDQLIIVAERVGSPFA